MTSKRHDNFINGNWVPGTRYAPNINPSNVSDVIGEYTQGDESQLGHRQHPGAFRFPGPHRQRDPRPQGGTRHAARARGGQDQGRRHR
jgi:hypothetical protein